MAGASVIAGASVAGAPQAVKSIAATTNKARVCQIVFFILLSFEKILNDLY